VTTTSAPGPDRGSNPSRDRPAPSPESLGAVSRVGRGTAISWLSWAGGRVLTLVTLILLTRVLSPKGLGDVLSALAAGVLGASLAMGGLPDATTRNAASSADGGGFGRGDVRRALVRFGIMLPGIGLLIVLIAYASSGPIDASFIIAGFLLAVTQGATTIIASVYRARGHAGRYALVNTVFAAAGRAVVAVIVYLVGASAGVVLWAFVALNVVVIALTWGAAMRGLPDTQTRRSGQGAMQLGGVVGSLMGNLDLVTVGVLLGASAAGMYGVALRVAEVSIQFLVALSVIYMPEATRLAVANRADALRSLYRTTTRWATLLSVLAAGVGFVAAPELAQIVFPSDPATEATLMRILFVGYAVHGALGQTYTTLLALGAYADIWRSSIVSLPIIVAGTVGLTVAFGTEGAAWSTCLAYALTGLWWAWQVRRGLGTGPFDEFYPRALGAAAVSLVVAVLVSQLGDALSPVGLTAAIMLAATAAWTAALMLTGGLSPHERSVAAQLVARFRSRKASNRA
jgi:O-antigen/teichoic acid export membrane protein